MRTFLLTFLLFLGSLSLSAQDRSDLSLVELYTHLHTHPELSFQEKETSAYLAEKMRNLGFEVTEGIGGYGVVCVLENGKGPTVMLRTDTDALPVIEKTEVPYASTVTVKDESGAEVGVMHACGHDVHMSVWYGTAAHLAANKKDWKGTLVMIAQPAEERSGGAKAMLAEGLFEKFPVPDYALALHVSADLEVGKVGYIPGFAMANVDMVKIAIFGRGGHGAAPHTTLDPVVLAARIILDLQTIVSRELDPLSPAVVTVGSIHGGTKGNVIPERVDLELTLRSYSDEVRMALIEKIKRICDGVAASAGVPEDKYPQVEVRDEYTPSLYNDPELTERVKNAFIGELGADQVEKRSPAMVGEDFGRYGRTEHDIPICMFRLGTVSAEKIAAAENGELSLPSLHSAYYAPEAEKSIDTGVRAMSAAVMDLMK